jgi:hypothetical protein
LQNLSATEFHSITTEHQKAAEPFSCHRQTKLPSIAMTNESNDLILIKHKAARLCFLLSNALSEQQIILVSFVKNVLGMAKK